MRTSKCELGRTRQLILYTCIMLTTLSKEDSITVTFQSQTNSYEVARPMSLHTHRFCRAVSLHEGDMMYVFAGAGHASATRLTNIFSLV